jgi:hypothetical protein
MVVEPVMIVSYLGVGLLCFDWFTMGSRHADCRAHDLVEPLSTFEVILLNFDWFNHGLKPS